MKKSGVIIVLTAMLALACPVGAQSTWTGGGGDNNWSTGANWNTPPGMPYWLIFDGNTRLNNNNDYAADTDIKGITFDTGAGAFTLGGTRWRLAVGGTIANFGGNTQTIATDIYLTSNQASYNRTGNNYTASTGNGSYINVASGTLILSGNIGGPTGANWGGNGIGEGGWVKTGAGTLVLSGSNTYSGGSIIDGGLVVVGSTNAFGTGASIGTGNSYQLMMTSGTVDLNGFDIALKGIHRFTSDITGLGAAGTAMITNNAAETAVLSFVGTNNAVYGLEYIKLSGNLRLNISVKDSASAILNANNDFTGGVTFANYNPGNNLYTDAGIGLNGVASSLGTGKNIEFNNGGFRLDNGGSNTLGQNVSVTGTNKLKTQGATSSSFAAPTIFRVTGTWTGNGLMVFTNGYTPNTVFDGDFSAFTGTFNLNAQGSSLFTITDKAGHMEGTAVAMTANGQTYAPSVVYLSGTGDSKVHLGDLSTYSVVNGNAYLDNATEGATVRNTAAGLTYFTVGFRNKNSVFDGNIIDSGVINRATGVITGTVADAQVGIGKHGTGTWELTGKNYYTGNTVVSGGVLLISGSGEINATAGVAVYTGGKFVYDSSTALTQTVTLNGGVLAGTGAVGKVNIGGSGGAIAPGDGAVGTLTLTGNQSLGGFTYNWDIASLASFDLIDITGELTFTGGVYTLNVGALGGFSDWESVQDLVILSAAAGLNGNVAWTTNVAGLEVKVSGNNLVLNYDTIPEPSTWLLLTGGAGLLAFLRRRKK